MTSDGSMFTKQTPYFAFCHGFNKDQKGVTVSFDAVSASLLMDVPEEGDGRYSALAKLITYNIDIRLPHDKFIELKDDMGYPEEGSWSRMDVSSGGKYTLAVRNADTDLNLDEEQPRAFLRQLSINELEPVKKRVALPRINTSRSEIKKLLIGKRIGGPTFISVYNVGQGLCCALCDEKSAAPLLYFDFGCGCYANAHTRPREMKFCFSQEPPIVLSHWHSDHYMGAKLLDDAALDMKWLAPYQYNVCTTTSKFAAFLHCNRNLLMWPDDLSYLNVPFGTIVKCKGGMLNRSGLALIARTYTTQGENEHSFKTLLPGDAGYDDICDSNMIFDAFVATHHGGDTTGNVPKSMGDEPIFAISYGNRNSYEHPKDQRMNDIMNAGWRRRLNTVDGNIALCWRGDNLPMLGCGGKECSLHIQQI
ncbi:MAG: hypothetical protein A2283_19025 [Lentisphaerae bacterium RIFOXYA12_FULL_48_11]|nr:MAG: hypothetical protein A2283_19025 [Lentisphaerae bacterium RIFOXYA12_FULL_48_11]